MKTNTVGQIKLYDDQREREKYKLCKCLIYVRYSRAVGHFFHQLEEGNDALSLVISK